LSTLPDSNHKK